MTYEEYCEIMDGSNFLIDSKNPYDMKIKEILELRVTEEPREMVRFAGNKTFICPACGSATEVFAEFKCYFCPKCGKSVDLERRIR